MKTVDQITEEEKWQIIINCVKEYDGVFYYGVKTTGIFCRPSCRAKNPNRRNVLFFDDANTAMKAGFRPCKRCQPNETTFQPDLDLVKKTIQLLDESYNEGINLKEITKSLGVSANHLTNLFKTHTGLTVIQYITRLRINRSFELLKEGETIIEVAYKVGFKSLSNFYKTFKEETGLTPNQYRKQR